MQAALTYIVRAGGVSSPEKGTRSDYQNKSCQSLLEYQPTKIRECLYAFINEMDEYLDELSSTLDSA